MSDRTPTPWVIRPERHDDWGWIRGADGELACIARHHDRKDDDKHRMDKTDPYAANAAFIVKAVNSHDALVKALEELLPLAGIMDDCDCDSCRPIQQARAVLASIKERA